jgi:hypothetical protein
MEGSGQGDVDDERHTVGGGLLADAGGDRAGALRDDARRRLAGFVLHRDGVVGRVDHDDVGVGDGPDHAVAAHRELTGTPLRLDQGVAVARLVLVLDLFLGHARLLAVAAHDDEDVGEGEQQTGRDRGLDQDAGADLRLGEHGRDAEAAAAHEHGHEALDREPEHQADDGRLDQRLRAVPQRLRPEGVLQAVEQVELLVVAGHALDVHAALHDGGREHGHADDREHRPDRRPHRARAPHQLGDDGGRVGVRDGLTDREHLVDARRGRPLDGRGDHHGGGTDAHPGAEVLRPGQLALRVDLFHPLVGRGLGTLAGVVRHVSPPPTACRRRRRSTTPRRRAVRGRRRPPA